MQWLYGSGEGGASNIQAYHASATSVLAAARARPADSVVRRGLDPRGAARLPCGDRPLAVVLDVDETGDPDLGSNIRTHFNPAAATISNCGNRWEQTGADAVALIPAGQRAARGPRCGGHRDLQQQPPGRECPVQTAAAIEGAGLGPARHGETLYLMGDVAPGSERIPRRAAIAGRFCVIALAGDQLGDFTDLFNARSLPVAARRAAATSGPLAALWGNGWFVLSNPVYGSGLRGGFDDVFPADKRWSDPAGEDQQ